MSLETATLVSQLVASNPVSNDPVGQGDDHLRMIKACLQNTFPNASGAFYFPGILTKTANFSVLATQKNITFLVDCTAGAVVATMPALVAGDAGFEIYVQKMDVTTNSMFIAPPSGTIQSGEIVGLARARRCVPGRRTRVLWTGTAWFAERTGLPIATVLDNVMTTLPVGYEFASGATLSSALNYPEYNAARGSLVLPDARGLPTYAKDNLGGTAANRIQVATTITTTNGSATAIVGSHAGIGPGMLVFASTVPAGTTVASVQLGPLLVLEITLSTGAGVTAGTGTAVRFSYWDDPQILEKIAVPRQAIGQGNFPPLNFTSNNLTISGTGGWEIVGWGAAPQTCNNVPGGGTNDGVPRNVFSRTLGVGGSIPSGGSALALPAISPGLITNKIVVVE